MVRHNIDMKQTNFKSNPECKAVSEFELFATHSHPIQTLHHDLNTDARPCGNFHCPVRSNFELRFDDILLVVPFACGNVSWQCKVGK